MDVTVEDNGAGIEGKYFETFFQVFQRLDQAAAHEGTGMGLTLCRNGRPEFG